MKIKESLATFRLEKSNFRNNDKEYFSREIITHSSLNSIEFKFSETITFQKTLQLAQLIMFLIGLL